MKVMVFPGRHQERVESVARSVLEPYAGAQDLTLVVTRVSEPQRWSVQATGVADHLRERGFSNIVETALKRSGV
jgi:pyruvate-formate lyase-activating enzyme